MRSTSLHEGCARLVGTLIVLLAVTAGGCGESMRKSKTGSGSTGLVEIEDSTPTMTPAQRDERFARCYEDGLRFAYEGRYALALSAFEQALELKPASVPALFNLGACHEATGDPLRAINIYRRVLELRPNDPDCYANLGTSFIKLYHRERSPVWRKMARESWRESLRLSPDQPAVREYLAMTDVAE